MYYKNIPAGVIQWQNASLPRRMSRVRASSPAPFKIIRKPLRLFFVSGVYVMKQMQKYLYFALLALFFLLGLTLRAKLFIANNVFSDDECRLVLSMLDKNLWDSFLFLGDAQSAPPIFVFCSQLLTYILGFQEHALKFIPFVSSIAAIYVFYQCFTQYFKKNYTR